MHKNFKVPYRENPCKHTYMIYMYMLTKCFASKYNTHTHRLKVIIKAEHVGTILS